MIAFVLGLFGLIVGSFLNVVIIRYGERDLGGRSSCMHCGGQLKWYDMFPVLSWCALKGKCRTCGTRISVQYPLVEAACAILFAFVGAAGLPLVAIPFALAAEALLICIFTYDLYHQLIPDLWVWLFNAAALIFSFLVRPPDASLLFLLLSGPIAALPLFALWAASRGKWMGFGDVKLALGIGWLLPQELSLYGILAVPAGFVAVWLAFFIGAVISVGILMPLPRIMHFFGITRLESAQNGFTMKSEVPFGPFLIASTFVLWLVLLYGLSVPFMT